jgi:adenine-specific DNA glycosylase
MKGLVEFPNFSFRSNLSLNEIHSLAQKKMGGKKVNIRYRGCLDHSITHHKLRFYIYLSSTSFSSKNGVWATESEIKNLPISSLVHKILNKEKGD